MKKFISMVLIALMVIGTFGNITVLAATEDSTMVYGGGYAVFEGVCVRERNLPITVPVHTQPISWGGQTGEWTHGVTGTHIVSETVSRTGQGRASVTVGSTGRVVDGGWRPTNIWSRATALRSPLGTTDRANWDLARNP